MAIKKLVLKAVSVGQMQGLWQDFFVRSEVESGGEFIVEVHGHGLWEKVVRPWMQKNIFWDDRQKFSILLVDGDRTEVRI